MSFVKDTSIPVVSTGMREVLNHRSEFVKETPMVRLFAVAPDAVELQIRSYTATTPNGNGKKRNMIAGAAMSVEQMKELRAALDEAIAARSF